jgi:hypothetical protein
MRSGMLKRAFNKSAADHIETIDTTKLAAVTGGKPTPKGLSNKADQPWGPFNAGPV